MPVVPIPGSAFSFTVLGTKGRGQIEIGGHGPVGQAAGGASDRDGIALSGSMTQPLATAPLDATQILFGSKHQCIFLHCQLWARIEKENADVK